MADPLSPEVPAADHSDAPVGIPGFRHGCWTIVIPAGSAFAMNLGYAVKLISSERMPGPIRDCLDKLYDAIEQAMPSDGTLGVSAQDGMVGRVYRWRGGLWRVLCRWRGRGPRNVLLENVSGAALVLPDGRVVEPGERIVRPFRGLRRP